ARFERHSERAERVALGDLGSSLRQRDAGALAHQQPCRRDPAPRRPNNGHAFAFDIESQITNPKSRIPSRIASRIPSHESQVESQVTNPESNPKSQIPNPGSNAASASSG